MHQNFVQEESKEEEKAEAKAQENVSPKKIMRFVFI